MQGILFSSVQLLPHLTCWMSSCFPHPGVHKKRFRQNSQAKVRLKFRTAPVGSALNAIHMESLVWDTENAALRYFPPFWSLSLFELTDPPTLQEQRGKVETACFCALAFVYFFVFAMHFPVVNIPLISFPYVNMCTKLVLSHNYQAPNG